MSKDLNSTQWADKEGRADGGQSFGPGFCIAWQRGPLVVNGERKEQNGAFIETVIAAVRDRLEFHQEGPFACKENQLAIDYLNAALVALGSRAAKREEAGVAGTHTPLGNVKADPGGPKGQPPPPPRGNTTRNV